MSKRFKTVSHNVCIVTAVDISHVKPHKMLKLGCRKVTGIELDYHVH
jgi:hypothetical protein